MAQQHDKAENGSIVSWPHALLGGLLALGLMAFLFWGTDWGQVQRALGELRWAPLGLALMASLLGVWFRALRWRLLLAPLGEAPALVRVWRIYMVGLGLSSFVPGRVGDLARPYLVGRGGGPSFASALATVVVEHVLDLLMVLLAFSLVFLSPAVLGSATAHSEGTAAVMLGYATAGGYALAVVAVVSVLLLLARREALGMRALQRLLTPLPQPLVDRLLEIASGFVRGLAGAGGGRSFLVLLGTTLAAWCSMAAAVHLNLLAFGIAVPLWYSVWLAAAIALGAFIPTPGGVGTYHAVSMLVVGQLWGFAGAQPGAVVAFALVSHLGFTLVVAMLASLCLWWEGVAIGELRRAAGAVGSEAER
jgi:uncharacterized protein (TIRG00374 family)